MIDATDALAVHARYNGKTEPPLLLFCALDTLQARRRRNPPLLAGHLQALQVLPGLLRVDLLVILLSAAQHAAT